MVKTYAYGFPRIGKNREYKKSIESFWKQKISSVELLNDIKDIEGTQNIFNHRARMSTLAAQGKWSNELENK